MPAAVTPAPGSSPAFLPAAVRCEVSVSADTTPEPASQHLASDRTRPRSRRHSTWHLTATAETGKTQGDKRETPPAEPASGRHRKTSGRHNPEPAPQNLASDRRHDPAASVTASGI